MMKFPEKKIGAADTATLNRWYHREEVTSKMRTFNCLANKADTEDLHFYESWNVDETIWDKDAKELADWLFENLSAGPYRAMNIQLRKREESLRDSQLG
jgi:hypothetical protein